MNFKLDLHSGIPIYVQLKTAIRMAVAAGHFPPGSRLPTVRQMAVDLKINPNTVSRVYQELEQEGLLSTRQGRGTFVQPSGAATAADAVEHTVAQEQLLAGLVDALLAQAEQWGITPAQVREALDARLARSNETKIDN